MRVQPFSVAVLCSAFLLLASGIALPLDAPQAVAAVSRSPGSAALQGPAGRPFASDAEAIDFLRHAEVVSLERIPDGVTHPRKVLLETDGVRAYAVFRDVEVSRDAIWLSDGTFHMRLRDSALFEVAAYRMAGLLGLDNVPPTVLRSIRNTKGSLQLWVEGAMTERHRRKNGLRPPDYGAWLAQMRTMALFDFLVGNIDRHVGNYLLDARGKIWFIDHTRAFQLFLAHWSPRRVAMCERHLWERLQALDEDLLRDTLSDVLTAFEIEKLVERLAALVSHIREQIAQRGESAVIT